MSLQSDFQFTLPRGYLDHSGHLHRAGSMRLATALDEIEVVGHPRVQANQAYLPVILLSRVVTRLGDLPSVTPQTLEQLFAADLAYLEDLYLRLNSHESVVVGAVCPCCSTHFSLQVAPLAGNGA
jgi:hypothetical protein